MKKNKYEVKQSYVSLYVMFGLLTMITLYFAYVFPKINILFYILSSFFIMGITAENKPLAAFITYLCVSAASLILMPISYALPYIALFGHYAIAKYLLERLKDKAIRFTAKLLYFNAFCAIIYFAVLQTQFLPSEIYSSLPVWALILILQPCFIIYDILLSVVNRAYAENIKDKITQ